MFSVEVRLTEDEEAALTAKMNAMREWLDHQRYEPSKFSYIFTSPGMDFRVDFKVETEAEAFAKAFGGRVVPWPEAVRIG